MNRPIRCQFSKRFRSRALGTVLLALPLCGIAFPPALAQAQTALPPTTTATPPATKPNFKPLSPEMKAKVDKYLALGHLESVCKTQLDLKVENATPEQVIARIQANFPTETIPIALRGVGSPAISFDLKEQNVGYLLQQVANRVGGNFYLLSGGLLIAPASQLTDAERGDVANSDGGIWAKNLAVGGNGWYLSDKGDLCLALAVVHELTGSDTKPLPPVKVKTTLDAFSPYSQVILQQLATWVINSPQAEAQHIPPIVLRPDSRIDVNTSDPNQISLAFHPGRPGDSIGSGGMSITVP